MSESIPSPRQQTTTIKRLVDDATVHVTSQTLTSGRTVVTTIDLPRADSLRPDILRRLTEAGYRPAEAETFLQITNHS